MLLLALYVCVGDRICTLHHCVRIPAECAAVTAVCCNILYATLKVSPSMAYITAMIHAIVLCTSCSWHGECSAQGQQKHLLACKGGAAKDLLLY